MASSWYTRRPQFLSTLSLRRATFTVPDLGKRDIRFLSTLSLRRATTSLVVIGTNCVISIHALLAESDRPFCKPDSQRRHFYPRSPCGERPIFAVRPYDAPIFLSTLSLRRATTQSQIDARVIPISIHALLAESDSKIPPPGSRSRIFLSTLSLRRATLQGRNRRN